MMDKLLQARVLMEAVPLHIYGITWEQLQAMNDEKQINLLIGTWRIQYTEDNENGWRPVNPEDGFSRPERWDPEKKFYYIDIRKRT